MHHGRGKETRLFNHGQPSPLTAMINLHDHNQDAARRRLWDEPRAADLLESIKLPAERYPDVVAIGLCHHGAESESITWGELWRAACAVAGRLSELGVREGDRVLLVLPTSRAFFEFFFGILLAGGIPVPVAPPTSLKEHKLKNYQDLLNNIAIDAGGAVCVSLARIMNALQAGLHRVNPRLRILLADEAPQAISPFTPSACDRSDTALLQYTSGSTGRPKGVTLSHGNILSNAAAIAQAIVEPDTVCVSWLPLYHDMGLIGTFLTSIYCRTPILFMPPQAFIKSPALWLRCISDYRATVTAAPNFAFLHAVKNVQAEELTDVSLDSLLIALNGAETVDLHAVERFYEKFGPHGLREGVIRPVYGLAESSLAVTFSDKGPLVIDTVDADRLEQSGEAVPAGPHARSRVIVSVGRPLETQEVQIVGTDGRALPERHVGEVVVRGPSVMKGYFNRAAETAEVMRHDGLRTGDLGYLSDGRLYITGRSKDIIIRHGKNYYSQDIEVCVARVEGVLTSGAVAFSVEGAGETKVVVVAETRLRDPEARAQMCMRIRIQCHDAFLFGPDDIRLVPPGAIPRTTSGKLRRQACKTLYLDGEFGEVADPAQDKPPRPFSIPHAAPGGGQAGGRLREAYEPAALGNSFLKARE